MINYVRRRLEADGLLDFLAGIVIAVFLAFLMVICVIVGIKFIYLLAITPFGSW